MILEHVPLAIDPEQVDAFEDAYAEAIELVLASDGCRGASLRRCVEDPAAYLLLIEWDTLEDHTVGFRDSERFGQWRALVGPFFATAPEVRHFTDPV